MKLASTIAAASIAIGAVATAAEDEHVQRKLIIGGKVVPASTKTYTAGLRLTEGGVSFCAGVLVSSKHVLTTMRCGTDAKYVNVGTPYVDGTEYGEVIQVASVQNHPLATNETNVHDFAMLTLKKQSNFPAISLSNANSIIEPPTLTKAMGWGNTSDPDGHPSHELRYLEMQVWNHTNCSAAYDWVGDADVCFSGASGTDLCYGDYGGPVIIEGKNGDSDDVLVGISSFVSCALPDAPSVYARVSAVIGWISKITGDTKKVKDQVK